MNSRTRLPLPEPEYKHWETNQHGHAVLEPTIAYTADQMHAYSDSENAALLVELSGFRSARIAYASEFPLNADGEPDIGNIHANIRAVKARVKVLEDALRTVAAAHAWQLFGESRAFGTDRIPSPGQCHDIARAALAQPAPEPVAWQVNVQTPSGPIVYGVYDNAKPGEHLKAACKDADIVVTNVPLFATPQAQPTPSNQLSGNSGGLPDGWVMVPREPSDDMLVAGQEAWAVIKARRNAIEDCKEAEAVFRAMIAAAPAQPADQWKAAIDDELVCCHIGTTDSFPDAKSALKNLIDWHVSVALDPEVSSDAQALIDREAAQPAVPLTDEQIDEMCGEANRGFCIERDDYRKAARDTERAHGISTTGGGK